MMKTSKVVRFPTGGTCTVSEDAMNIVRLKMYDWHIEDLAEEVGVSKSCLYSIRSGRTKWPRPLAFFGLLRALGLEMIIREKK